MSGWFCCLFNSFIVKMICIFYFILYSHFLFAFYSPRHLSSSSIDIQIKTRFQFDRNFQIENSLKFLHFDSYSNDIDFIHEWTLTNMSRSERRDKKRSEKKFHIHDTFQGFSTHSIVNEKTKKRKKKVSNIESIWYRHPIVRFGDLSWKKKNKYKNFWREKKSNKFNQFSINSISSWTRNKSSDDLELTIDIVI